MKESKKSKKIGAIFFGLIFGLFIFIGFILPSFSYFLGHDIDGFEGFFPIVYLGIGLLLLFCIVYVIKERLQDLKNGEEDDLDKY